MRIETNNIRTGFELFQGEYEQKIIDVLRSGWYILGNELERFENEYADYLGIPGCAGVGSGLDALSISLKLLGISCGDEVILPANTFIASVISVTNCGAIPIFVEPDEYYSIDVTRIEEKITKKTKAVMAVHLYGMPCQMDCIDELCRKYSLVLIEDCAQSHGALFMGKQTGTFGKAGCFSFYPTKNLGAYGDGGCIVSSDLGLIQKVKVYRNYGSEKKYYNQMIGVNSRLDELQAGLLRVKLSHLNELIKQRRIMAKTYIEGIHNSRIVMPKIRPQTLPVWHQFVVRCENRNKFMRYMEENGISTLIHYPIPAYRAEAYKYLDININDYPTTERYANEICSLPFYDGMSEDIQSFVIDRINNFER